MQKESKEQEIANRGKSAIKAVLPSLLLSGTGNLYAENKAPGIAYIALDVIATSYFTYSLLSWMEIFGGQPDKEVSPIAYEEYWNRIYLNLTLSSIFGGLLRISSSIHAYVDVKKHNDKPKGKAKVSLQPNVISKNKGLKLVYRFPS